MAAQKRAGGRPRTRVTQYVGEFTGIAHTGNALGNAPYAPQKGSWQALALAVIQQVIIDEEAYLPLRPRAFLYRLMSTPDPNNPTASLATKDDNQRVIDLIASARRGGLIDYDAIDDGRTQEYDIGGYSDPDTFFDAMIDNITGRYRRWLRQSQEFTLEVYVESAGYVPVLRRTGFQYGATMITGSGFNPFARLRQSANDAFDQWFEANMRTAIALLGDNDIAGGDRVDRVAADIRQFFAERCVNERGMAFVDAMTLCHDVIVMEHLGLTLGQAQQMNLLPAPETRKDTKGVGAMKYELEAVQPAVVVGWLQDWCERYTDLDQLDLTKRHAKMEAASIKATLTKAAAEGRWGQWRQVNGVLVHFIKRRRKT